MNPEIPNPISLQMTEQAAQINSIVAQMESISSEDTVRLPEHVFVNLFLSLFTGEAPSTHFTPTLAKWATAARGNFNPVIVVNREGKEIFTVPPLLDRTAVDAGRSVDGVPIAHSLTTVDQIARISPMAAARRLDQELMHRATILKVPVNVMKNLETWNEIFKRYNKPLIETTQTTAIASQPVVSAVELDYDPL